MSGTLAAMEFRRINGLPPYVFTIIDQLKAEARRAGRVVSAPGVSSTSAGSSSPPRPGNIRSNNTRSNVSALARKKPSSPVGGPRPRSARPKRLGEHVSQLRLIFDHEDAHPMHVTQVGADDRLPDANVRKMSGSVFRGRVGCRSGRRAGDVTPSVPAQPSRPPSSAATSARPASPRSGEPPGRPPRYWNRPSPAQTAPSQTLTLLDAVELARKNYPAVKESRARAKGAQEGVGLARTAYVPRLDVLWQGNRATRNNVFGLLLPEVWSRQSPGPSSGRPRTTACGAARPVRCSHGKPSTSACARRMSRRRGHRPPSPTRRRR